MDDLIVSNICARGSIKLQFRSRLSIWFRFCFGDEDNAAGQPLTLSWWFGRCLWLLPALQVQHMAFLLLLLWLQHNWRRIRRILGIAMPAYLRSELWVRSLPILHMGLAIPPPLSPSGICKKINQISRYLCRVQLSLEGILLVSRCPLDSGCFLGIYTV